MTETPQRYFAFLRGINVGRRRLTNQALIEPFLALGLADVAAYRAAGNITFCSAMTEEELLEKLRTATTEAYGFETPMFLRSQQELTSIADLSPFSVVELEQTDG